MGTCYTGGEGKNEIKNWHEVQKENTEVTKGVKQKIEAFERLNEGQRLLLEKKKSTPGSEKLKTKTRRRVKGGGLNTPQNEKNKFKAQKTTLKDLWGPETRQAGGHK